MSEEPRTPQPDEFAARRDDDEPDVEGHIYIPDQGDNVVPEPDDQPHDGFQAS